MKDKERENEIERENEKERKNEITITVCFISTVTFHEGVAQKVIKIIQFCKKHMEDNTFAFCYQ